MDDFKFQYLTLCKEYRVEPQDTVIKQLKSAQVTPRKGRGSVLNLSTGSLTVKTCAIIGKILETDRIVHELRFADCMLNEDGVKSILHGLSSNVACRKLDLKGNNIRSGGSEAIGRMLTHNKTLISLCLEWNSLGINSASFAILCEGISTNATLKELDLRNNQITHEGATELSMALKRNTTIRGIDLRWNSVGLIGGRNLLSMLQVNKTVVSIQLAGNNMPGDILRSVETALGHNEDRELMTNEYLYRTETLSKQVTQIKEDRDLQLSDLLNQIDNQEEKLRISNRTTSAKVIHLQEALEERKSAFNTLVSKMQLTETELALSEQKRKDLEAAVHRLRQDQSDLSNVHHSEIKKEKEERGNVESKLLHELADANERNVQLELKSDELDKTCRRQKEQVFELKEQLTHQQAELKLKLAQYEEKLQNEKQRFKESQRETEQMKQREVTRVKQDAEETERGLRDKISKLERNRLDLEEDISKLKSAQMTNKIEAEESLMIMRQKIKNEEDQRYKALEERLRMVQISKDDLQNHSNQQSSTVNDLQARNGKLMLEIEALKRKNDDQSQEISGKNQEMMAAVEKVKLDVKQKVLQIENEKEMQDDLKQTIKRHEKELSDIGTAHRNEIQMKESEISSLKQKLKEKEAEINHFREDEQQRMSMLQSAVMNFASRSPYTPR